MQTLIRQKDIKAIDSYGRHWIVCEKCGEIKEEGEFVSYGGLGRANIGICRDCSRSYDMRRIEKHE